MMFLELHEGTIGLDDMKRIVHKLLENKAVFRQLSPELYNDLAYIITPTLASDHNEANIRAKFREVVQNFVIQGDSGQPMRFYRDEQFNRLYFGDEAGWKEAQGFEAREMDASLLQKKSPKL
jgi:hypothetical protein